MEIKCGLVNLTMIERSRAMCTGVESALAALLIPALVKAELPILTQEYMKLLTKHTKLGGDDHTSCPSEPVDAENDGGDEDDDEDEGEGEDDGKSDAKSGPNGVGENGDSEDDEEVREPNEEDDSDDGEDDEEGVGDETEEDEEEALQPPRKRKK